MSIQQTRGPDQDSEVQSSATSTHSSETERTAEGRGNAYIQDHLKDSVPESGASQATTEESTPWVQGDWEEAATSSQEGQTVENDAALGPQISTQPGAEAGITEEAVAEAPLDSELELPTEATQGLEEDGGHTSAEPSGDAGGEPAVPTDGASPPPSAPLAPGDPQSAEGEGGAPITAPGESSARNLDATANLTPTMPVAPVVSGDGPTAQFIEGNARQVEQFVSQADQMQAQIMSAAQASAAAIDAAIAQGRNEIDTAIAAAKSLSESELAAAHTQIDAEADRALAAVDSKVDAALASVDVAHGEQIARLETISSAQTAQVQTAYSTWQGKFDAIGPAIGQEAIQLGASRASSWRGQKNGESTLLDGPVHDNRMEARAEAAENVASQYRDSLMSSAAERAGAVQSGCGRDLEAIQSMRQASSTVLNEQRAATLNGLEGNRQAGRARVEQTRAALHQAVDQRHATAGSDLNQVQAARHAQLETYGGAQRDAIIDSGIDAAENVSQEATQAGSAMMGALHELQGATQGQEPPATPDLVNALNEAQDQFNTVQGDATDQLQQSANMSASGIESSRGEIEGALGTLTGESESGLKEGAQTTSRELSDFQTAGSSAFQDVLSAHDQTLQTGLAASQEGFKSVGDGIETRFGEMNQSLESGFTEGAQGLEGGLRDSLKDEDRDISKYAEEAAARVQPRWKKVLKVALIIAVIVAVCIVAGPLAAGLGAIGLSGLGAAVAAGTILGAAAGATIQMSHNMVDGREIMDGVGKAAITGAVGGAFGGLGAGLAAGVANMAGRIGIEFGLDAIGGILGELAVGNAPTLEGVLIGAGIGAGVGIGMRGVSAIRPKLNPDVTPTSKLDVAATPSAKADVTTRTMPEGPTNTAQNQGTTPTKVDTPQPKARSRAKSNGAGDAAEIRTQVEARFGSDGAEAFDSLVAATRNPKQAEATLRYAQDLDMSDELVAMIRSGKLDVDTLRGLGKNVRTAQAEVLNGIDTGRYQTIEDALSTSGTRHEILEAANRTAIGHQVSLGGRATAGKTLPAGKADLIDYTSGEAVQMKVVTGRDADAVIRNIDSATEQLGGQVKSGKAANAEIPPEGMQRIADIRIGDGSILRGASRAETLSVLQGRLSHLDNLDSTLSQHGHTTPPKQAGEVRIDTGHPDGPFRFHADELRGSNQTLDGTGATRSQPEMPGGIPEFLQRRVANSTNGTATPAQKVLETGREVILPDGSTGRVRKVEADDVHVDRNGQTEIHSRPDILERMKVDSQQVDAQPGLDANYAGESTRYQPFDGPAFNADGPSPRAVNQGSLGDCWFMAAMGATSRQQPTAVRKLVQNNGNGTYDVTLHVPDNFGNLRPSTKTVDMNFPSKDGVKPLYAKTGDQDEWWAALLEKRLAMETGSYEAIRGSNIHKHMRFNGGTDLLTGQRSRYIRTGDQSNDQLLQTLKTAMDEGRPVTAGAHSESATDTAFNQAGKAEGVVFNHAYSLKAVDVENGTVTLDNPWGPNVKDLVIDIEKFQKYFQSMNISSAGNSVSAPRTQPELANISGGMAEAPMASGMAPKNSAATLQTTPGAFGSGPRRTPGPEAESDFLGGRTTNDEADQIREKHGIEASEHPPNLSTIPEAWLPRYVEIIRNPKGKPLARKYQQVMNSVWGAKSKKYGHRAMGTVHKTESIRAMMNQGQLPTGKFGWDQYGNTPTEAMESLERLSDIFRLIDNADPAGHPTARAQAANFLAIRDWIEVSEQRVTQYLNELGAWRDSLPASMDPSVAMLDPAKMGVSPPPNRIFQDLSVEELSPWRRQIENLGFDVDRLRNPGVSGGRATRDHWMDGQTVSKQEEQGIQNDAVESNALDLGHQIAGLQSGQPRSAREVVAAAEAGVIPRFVARVGKYPDSFSARTSGDVYAADVADLRGMVGKPEEAMTMVGWEKAAIDRAKEQGSDVYITVVDTEAAGWKTSEIDMGGVKQMAMRDIQDPNSRFGLMAAESGIKADDLPNLFAEMDQLPPGVRPEHLETFTKALDSAYAVNSLYSGTGFTVTDSAMPGRAGNVGAREVKVSSEDLTLDPAGRNVWWFTLKLGSLSSPPTPPQP